MSAVVMSRDVHGACPGSLAGGVRHREVDRVSSGSVRSLQSLCCGWCLQSALARVRAESGVLGLRGSVRL